ncbi:NADPH dehydrogenase NamA [Sulfurihydrogenibium azorense]|uniref:NADPH dehydrogenase NamA n=1 Tax=Sulfurihydrogenibium azorense TaxID=309806 RepID=UPI002409F971|nr:NADPH dehydrogenase NamA [Sulfurihydrogenibium azorense]MDM7273582.1 NADPH dehydrogenase NamA [Sulfurihydrogenibium azorense]
MLYSHEKIRGVTLKNRIVMSPMCMYSSHDGFVSDWHMVHLGSRAVGGAGLIFLEATAVEPRGRISPSDLGIWKDEHIEGLRNIVNFCHNFGAKVGIQLAHAGRKAEDYNPWERESVKIKGSKDAIAPSPLQFGNNWHIPKEMNKKDIEEVQNSFVNAAKRAVEAGFDIIEIHAAHGYLIHEFLSLISNHRTDEYGGSLENRERFLLEVVKKVRNVIPESMPLFVRLSCVDHVEDGWTLEDSIHLAKRLKEEGCDVIDCSSGGILESEVVNAYPGFQVPYSEKIKREAKIKTMTVGLIKSYYQAEEMISNNRADLVAIGREFLKDPYLPIRWALSNNIKIQIPKQYLRGWF